MAYQGQNVARQWAVSVTLGASVARYRVRECAGARIPDRMLSSSDLLRIDFPEVRP